MAAPSPKQDPSIPKFDQQTLYIAGKRYSTPETFQSIDPATNEKIADVSIADRSSQSRKSCLPIMVRHTRH
jgi:hypothetical protein